MARGAVLCIGEEAKRAILWVLTEWEGCSALSESLSRREL